MQTASPFVEIPPELEQFIGKRDLGTRIYRAEGSQEESAVWFDVITEIIGPSVSPGGVGMYCPVSRAAVYKRVKEGKLSMFLFHVTHRKTSLFGKNRILRETPYGYIPVSEAKAWREELEKRALDRGGITGEELEGAKPDWNGNFLQWKNRRERMGFFDAMKQDGVTSKDLALGLARALLGKNYEFQRQPAPPPRSIEEQAAIDQRLDVEERTRNEAVKKVLAKRHGSKNHVEGEQGAK